MFISVFSIYFLLLSPFDHLWVYTGQCYGHWVDKSYCPWFTEPYVVGFGQMIEKIWKRRTCMYLWEIDNPLCLLEVWSIWICGGFIWEGYRLKARNTFALPPSRGNFRDNDFLKAQCLASILVGWLQLASGAFVYYQAVKLYIYIYIKNL